MTDIHALESGIHQRMQTQGVPGLALAIVHHDSVIYARGFGHASVETDNALPVTPETLFRIGSVTKPLTGTMLMRLVEGGVLDLDRPISEYVPWLRFSEAGAVDSVTLRMLLNHTSGLPSDLHYHNNEPGSNTLENFARERIPAYPLIAPPGQIYFYSNPGINLAAYIAEAVTDQPYTQLMREYLFTPLKMSRSTFELMQAATYPLALAHIRDASQNVAVKRPHIDNAGEYPCGFAFSTVMDLSRFMRLHLKGGMGLLPADALHEMHRTQIDRLNGEGYGLTFRTRQYKGLKVVAHNGAIGKYGAVMLLLPEKHFGFVMLFNRAPGFWADAGQIMRQFVDAFLDLSAEAPPTETPSVPGTSAFLGTYLGPSTGLVQIDSHEVRLNGEVVDRPALGRVDDRTLMVNGLPVFAYDYAPFEAKNLSQYEGVYLADIDRWRVRGVEDRLQIDSEDEAEQVFLLPLEADRFACDWGVIEFQRQAGEITSLRVAKSYTFSRSSV